MPCCGAIRPGLRRSLAIRRCPAGVRYVITSMQLPACRVTPPGNSSAPSPIRSTSHYYDPLRKRVTENYGILQPRVGISLPGNNRSLYARLYGGRPEH